MVNVIELLDFATGNRAPSGFPTINSRSWQAKNLLAWFPMRPGFRPGINYAPRGGVWEGTVGSNLTTRVSELGVETLDFPGATGDAINFPAGTGPIDVSFLGGMTISAWVRFVDTADNFQVVMAKSITASTGSIFSLAMNNSDAISLRLATATGVDLTALTIVDPDNFPTSIWTHVAGVLVPSTEGILYVNAVDKASAATTRTGLFVDAGKDFEIGDDPNRTDPRMAWDGQIMDVRIYDRFLSPSEMRALWHPQTRWDLYKQLDSIYYPSIAVAGDTFNEAISLNIQNNLIPTNNITFDANIILNSSFDLTNFAILTFNPSSSFGASLGFSNTAQIDFNPLTSLGILLDQIPTSQMDMIESQTFGALFDITLIGGAIFEEDFSLNITLDQTNSAALTISGAITLTNSLGLSLNNNIDFSPNITFTADFDLTASASLTINEAISLASQFALTITATGGAQNVIKGEIDLSALDETQISLLGLSDDIDLNGTLSLTINLTGKVEG